MRTATSKSVGGSALAGKAAGVDPNYPPSALSAFFAALQNDTALKRVGEVQVGEFVGTGAALDVALDFDPIFVMVYNLTDGDVAGFGFNTASVGTKSAELKPGAADTVFAQEAAQGILFAAVGSKKFSLGTSVVLNETGKTFQYLAIGA